MIDTFINKIPAQICLWLAVMIFAASNSVIRKLTEIGSQNLVDGRNPISFCNVLFVGNLCALLVLLLIYRQPLKIQTFRQFSNKDWAGLAVVTLLSGVLAPGFMFEALSRTMVTNVVLVGRIEPLLILALSVWWLGKRVGVWEVTGALLSFAGVIAILLLQNLGGPMERETFNAGVGEVFAALGAVALGVSSIISKTRLARIPVGVFMTFRTAVGTVVFFFIALYVYGSHHFTEIFSPFLWQWMLVYGAVIVAIGQSLWLTGLKAAKESDALLAGTFNPIGAILVAYLTLGEAPTPGQYIGCLIILGGILLIRIGNWRRHSSTKTSNFQEMESGISFKGV